VLDFTSPADVEDIGAGTHERTVVWVTRLIEKMTAKYGTASSAI